MLNNLQIRKIYVPLQSFRTKVVLTREHSSVGLEHLPYKQRVGGSTPSAPTKAFQIFLEGFFYIGQQSRAMTDFHIAARSAAGEIRLNSFTFVAKRIYLHI